MAVASTRLLPGHGGAPRVARTGLAVAAALAVVTLMVASSGQRQMKESVSVSGMERRQVLERKASTQLASEELAHLDHLNAALFPKEDTAHVFSHAAGKSEAANRWIAKHRQDAFTARRAQHKLRAQHTRRAQHKLTALAAAEKHALGDEVLDFGVSKAEDMGDVQVPGDALGQYTYMKGRKEQQLARTHELGDELAGKEPSRTRHPTARLTQHKLAALAAAEKHELGDEVLDFGVTKAEDMGDVQVPGEALGQYMYMKGKKVRQLAGKKVQQLKLPTLPRPDEDEGVKEAAGGAMAAPSKVMAAIFKELAGEQKAAHSKPSPPLGDEVVDFGTTPSEDMGDMHVDGEALGTKGFIYKATKVQQLKRKRATGKLFLGEGPWADVATPGEMAGRGLGGVDGTNGVSVDRNPITEPGFDPIGAGFKGRRATSLQMRETGEDRRIRYQEAFARMRREALLRSMAQRRAQEQRMGLASLAEPSRSYARLPGLASFAPLQVLRANLKKETAVGGITADNVVGFPNMPGNNHDDVEVPVEAMQPYMYRAPHAQTLHLEREGGRKAPVTMLASAESASSKKATSALEASATPGASASWAKFFEAQGPLKGKILAEDAEPAADGEPEDVEATVETSEGTVVPALGDETLDGLKAPNDSIEVEADQIHNSPKELTWQNYLGSARKDPTAAGAETNAYKDHDGAHYGLSDRAGSQDLNAYYDTLGATYSTPDNDKA